MNDVTRQFSIGWLRKSKVKKMQKKKLRWIGKGMFDWLLVTWGEGSLRHIIT